MAETQMMKHFLKNFHTLEPFFKRVFDWHVFIKKESPSPETQEYAQSKEIISSNSAAARKWISIIKTQWQYVHISLSMPRRF